MLWKPACRSPAMLGTAVFTTAMSSISIAVAAQTTARVSRERFMVRSPGSESSRSGVVEEAGAQRQEVRGEVARPGGRGGPLRAAGCACAGGQPGVAGLDPQVADVGL